MLNFLGHGFFFLEFKNMIQLFIGQIKDFMAFLLPHFLYMSFICLPDAFKCEQLLSWR